MMIGYAFQENRGAQTMNATGGKSGNKADVALGLWMIIGINLGIAIGVSVDNLGAGIAIGMGLGISIGMLSRMMIRRKSRQAGDTDAE
ncbi:MAG TPA: hypothetical protein VF267_09595 [Gammaproteobacteria bacterium]